MPLSLKWQTRFVPKIRFCFICWKSVWFNLWLIRKYWGILRVVVEKFHNQTVVIVPSTNVWVSRRDDAISYVALQNAWFLLFFASFPGGNNERGIGGMFSSVLQTDNDPTFDRRTWVIRYKQDTRSGFSPCAGNKSGSFVLWFVSLLLSVKVYSYFI